MMCCSLLGTAQQSDHFIYIQSDNKQPFYVKVGSDGIAINSSSSGYLILPKIPAGNVSLTIGFSDKSAPEQHFVCPIPGDKDKGYLLKHFPDKGWALYDMQELTLIYAQPAPGGDSTQVSPAPVQTAQETAPAQTAQATAPAATVETPAAPAPATPTVQTPAAAAPTTPAAETPAAPAPTVAETPAAPAPPATTPAADTTPAAPPPAQDAFGDILVAVTKDPTLKDIKTTRPPAPKPAPAAPGKHAPDSTAIALVSTQTTADGVQRVYTDRQASGRVDTVQILFPGAASDAGGSAQSGALATTPPGNAAPVTVAPTPTDAGSTAVANAGATPTSGSAPVDTTQVAAPPAPGASAAAPPTTPAQTTVDTTQAFNPSSLVKSGKNKDTSNYVVPVFKQGDSSTAGQSAEASGSLAAGFGVQSTASTTAAAPTGGGLPNSDCKRIAGDDDFLRLRKKMASEGDADRMIESAKKAFKKSCYTTEQVKQLSFLFNLEDERYKFLEEAYPFVSDSGNFRNLQGLFSSAYFVNRFKALVQR